MGTRIGVVLDIEIGKLVGVSVGRKDGINVGCTFGDTTGNEVEAVVGDGENEAVELGLWLDKEVGLQVD